jgi:recombination protein RecT
MSETTAVVLSNKDLAKPIASEGTVESLFEQYRRSFEIAAPQHLDVNRVMRVALMTVSRNPYLLECTAASLLGAFMLSVQLGLDIGAKECHLVPFKNKYTGAKEIQLIPDYRGVIKLIRNSRRVCGMRVRCVYKQDLFQLEEGSQPLLRHVPNYDHPRDPKDIIGCYSIADFCDPATLVPTGYTDIHFLPRVHIDKVREMSPAKDSGPWVQHYAEMAMKTTIKHHAKSLPYSIEVATAIELDNRVEMARPQGIDLLENPQTKLITAEVTPEPGEGAETAGAAKPETQKPSGPAISEPQAKRAFAIAKGKGFTPEQYSAIIQKFGFSSDRDITKAKYDEVVAAIERGPNNAA